MPSSVEAPAAERIAALVADSFVVTRPVENQPTVRERVMLAWPQVEAAAEGWRRMGDFGALSNALRRFVEKVDAPNLRFAGWPLKGGMGDRDFLLQARLLQACYQAIEPDDPPARLKLSAALADRSTSWPAINIAAGEEHLAAGDFDTAMRYAKIALAIFSVCPASTDLLYRATLAKRDAGQAVSETEVTLDNLSDRFCSAPFETLVTAQGYHKNEIKPPDAFCCPCGSWLPYNIAAGTNEETGEDVWNGDAIQEVRRSILDGDYSYCSRILCPYIVGRSLPKKDDVTDPVWRDVIDNHKTKLEARPRHLQLSHDPSCNLACPTCRVDLQVVKSHQRAALDEFVDRIIKPLMREMDGYVLITGYGDPFGSKHYRKVIGELDPAQYPGVKLEFLTNALLLTPREWELLGNVRELVRGISVSIDAATAATYEDVRRPGKWDLLVENMKFLGATRAAGGFPRLQTNFVVQAKNFREMPDFVALGHEWNVDVITFQKYYNFGAETSEHFISNDVADPRHPDHSEFVELLKDPCFSDQIVSMFNLASFGRT